MSTISIALEVIDTVRCSYRHDWLNVEYISRAKSLDDLIYGVSNEGCLEDELGMNYSS